MINQKKVVIASIVFSLSLLVITAVAYVLILPPEIPLFYSLGRPQDHLAAKEFIFLFPAISLLITLLEIPFGRLNAEHETTTQVYVLISLFLILLLGLSCIRILFLVT